MRAAVEVKTKIKLPCNFYLSLLICRKLLLVCKYFKNICHTIKVIFNAFPFNFRFDFYECYSKIHQIFSDSST